MLKHTLGPLLSVQIAEAKLRGLMEPLFSVTAVQWNLLIRTLENEDTSEFLSSCDDCQLTLRSIYQY